MAEKDEDKEKRKREWDSFWDFGLGGFEEMDSLMKKMWEDMMKAFENPETFPKGGKSRVYGFSLKVGPDGKPVFQRFGDIQPPKKPEGEDMREPFSDVIDKDKEINVIVELPGVEKEDIKIDSKAREITVKVEKEGRKYFKKIGLPVEVIAEKSKSNYKNGVLEIILPKKNLVTQK